MTLPLDIASLAAACAGGSMTPAQMLDAAFARIAAQGESPVWIRAAPRERIAA
jgi:hypothetical protein